MGCDASVLLESTPFNSRKDVEKEAGSNIGLGSLDLIDNIKAQLADDGVNASCADIIAFAARDAAKILSGGKITYNLTRGRVDGVNSSAAAADASLPGPDSEFAALERNFAARNFAVGELVALSGAHSVGIAHLSSFRRRLDPVATPAGQIDENYRKALNDKFGTTLVSLKQRQDDPTEPNNVRDETAKFQSDARYNMTAMEVNATKGVLDNSYYHNNLVNKVLFKSDWVLRTNTTAAKKLDDYKTNATMWFLDFAAAMIKLSNLPAQGNHFEFRTTCRKTNKQSYG
ncbi:hypothetical protein ACP70R_041213 [Stipagrostis hirtigluma subsp. patula]